MKKARRTFTVAYKTQIALELIANPSAQAELCRRDLLSPDVVKQWKQHFLDNAVAAFGGDSRQQQHEHQVADLERMVGQLTVENSILKKASAYLTSASSANGRSR